MHAVSKVLISFLILCPVQVPHNKITVFRSQKDQSLSGLVETKVCSGTAPDLWICFHSLSSNEISVVALPKFSFIMLEKRELICVKLNRFPWQCWRNVQGGTKVGTSSTFRISLLIWWESFVCLLVIYFTLNSSAVI